MSHFIIFYLFVFFNRDKMPKTKFSFYCSRVRMRNYEPPRLFLDIIVDQHVFEEEFCVMASSLNDLDVTEERSNYPKPALEDEQCDYYEQFDKPFDLYVAFSKLLVRLYLNFVLNCLFELDLTLADEKTLIQLVCKYARGMTFFGRQIIFLLIVF